MEEKLAAFRAKKEKDREAENSLLNRLKKYFSRKPTQEPRKAVSFSQSPLSEKSGQDDVTEGVSISDNLLTQRVIKNGIRSDPKLHENQNGNNCQGPMTRVANERWWLMLFLKSLLWLCIWGIFIELEFGAVYFAVSLIIFIYFNTRTSQKDDKPSAYSVFNKNFEQIQGTVTAEQLQQNMFRIPGVSS